MLKPNEPQFITIDIKDIQQISRDHGLFSQVFFIKWISIEEIYKSLKKPRYEF